MDELTQIYIDRLAESNHNCIMLELENRNLKRKIDELEKEIGKDKEENKEEVKED